MLKQPSRQATKTKAKSAGVIHRGTCMCPLKSVHRMGGSSTTSSSAPSAVGAAGCGAGHVVTGDSVQAPSDI